MNFLVGLLFKVEGEDILLEGLFSRVVSLDCLCQGLVDHHCSINRKM
jgi:hypothetical protein